MNFEKDLNQNQYEAVTTSSQYVRVVAGAGSGKTRVLTYRIAYLLDEIHAAPWSILAITFTNKVANEMKKRVVDMIPDVNKDLTIRTFHSFAANFLRHEIKVIGFPSSFTILDEEDQTKLVKDIISEMGYKKSDKIGGKALNYIGAQKLKGLYPEEVKLSVPSHPDEKECLEIYHRYEEQKNKNLSLDFDDLLLKTNYILENFEDIRFKWQQRIDYILIDEFQDTNDIEYKMVKYLMKPYTCLYVVGDPDQTIYTWRGANQDIILQLNKNYPELETIILDRNYRSTQNILNSANKLIAHNRLRVAKNLYTEEGKGEPIIVRSCSSSSQEADFVAREIIQLKRTQGLSYKDIVILYRASYVSMEFEAALTQRGIPYKIYGGTKFYQRREIKDLLAYFHLLINTKDDISFERIMNVPKRGIGETSLSLIKKESIENNMSQYDYIVKVNPDDSQISTKVINSLKSMIMIFENTKDKLAANEEVFSKTLEDMIIDLGYYTYLENEDDGDERIENVKALFSDIRHYLQNNPESSFDEYLQNIALLSAQDELIEGDFVTLMTVHTAKGLEFPAVFVVRLNQGVFPHVRSQLESGFKGLEEERRLAYVAMTRAKQRLYLTFSGDYSYVLQSKLLPSQFLKESGNEIINNVRPSSYSSYTSSNTKQQSYHFNDGPHLSFESEEPRKQDFSKKTNDISSWNVGDIVIHKAFGKGIVVELEGDDIIKVNFENHGTKSIMGNHPSVSKGGSDA